MVFNTTFNNISIISWWPVSLVEETGVPGEKKRKLCIKTTPKKFLQFSYWVAENNIHLQIHKTYVVSIVANTIH